MKVHYFRWLSAALAYLSDCFFLCLSSCPMKNTLDLPTIDLLTTFVHSSSYSSIMNSGILFSASPSAVLKNLSSAASFCFWALANSLLTPLMKLPFMTYPRTDLKATFDVVFGIACLELSVVVYLLTKNCFDCLDREVDLGETWF